MKRMIFLALLLTGCADNLSSAAQTQVQMTPPFDGSGAQARQIWVSPDGPVSDINAALQMAAPGTDVMVKAGTYTENVRFSKDGGADAPIQLISADGHGMLYSPFFNYSYGDLSFNYEAMLHPSTSRTRVRTPAGPARRPG